MSYFEKIAISIRDLHYYFNRIFRVEGARYPISVKDNNNEVQVLLMQAIRKDWKLVLDRKPP